MEILTQEIYTNIVDARTALWATAKLTYLEQSALCVLRRHCNSWGEVKTLLLEGSTDYLLSKVDSSDPNSPAILDEVTEAIFVESAIHHGCSVAWRLYTEQSRPLKDFVWSYLTKNRAYRFFSRRIENLNPQLLVPWVNIERKNISEKGNQVLIRPKLFTNNGEDLVGVEKLECYWPCQLLRYLEAYRLGMNPDIAPEQRSAYKVEWNKLDQVIASSVSIEDLCVGVALTVVQELRKNKVSHSDIIKVLTIGYNPTDPLNEHGQEAKIDRIWRRIIDGLKVQKNFKNNYIRSIIVNLSERKQKAGYGPFMYL